MRVGVVLMTGLVCGAVAGVAAPQVRFDDLVRNLRNPEPRARLESIRTLRQARHPEAILPLAPLVNDPVDAIQLEAIAAELSFFLVDDVPERRRFGFVEVRNRGSAVRAFHIGPLAVWPRSAPPELLMALVQAADDENPKVRFEAIYALGTIARPPVPEPVEPLVVRALDHYDPAIREAAARIAGRLGLQSAFDALLKAVSDSRAEVRYAAMRALGMLRDPRAVAALGEQFTFYGKGEGAWSALDGLARIAHSSNVPLFASLLGDRDPYIRRTAAEGLGRTGNTSHMETLETAAASDSSAMVRAAMQYALQKLGRNYVARLVEFLDDERTAAQVQEYLIDLGPSIEPDLLPSLQEPDADIRVAVADVLGEIGGDASLSALRAMEGNKGVTDAAARAIERIRLRRLP